MQTCDLALDTSIAGGSLVHCATVLTTAEEAPLASEGHLVG